MNLDLLDESLLAQLFTCLGAGFLSALTPCVYPLIPVTVAIFTQKDRLPRSHQIIRSTLYAFGICVTYTVLGILAAQAGLFFGSYLGTTWFLSLATIALLTMALVTLDVFHFDCFKKAQNVGHKIGGDAPGYLSTFLMGVASGLIAAPCIGPILATVLSIAASHQQPLIGGVLLFFYSLGLSIPFWLIGTFTGLLQRLPRSGSWLSWIKFITAVGILLTIGYFHRGFINAMFYSLKAVQYPLAVGSLFAFGILFGKSGISYRKPMVTFLGTLLCSIPVYLFTMYQPVSAPPIITSSGITWSQDLKTTIENRTAKVILVDTFATWCTTCNDLDEKTFSDAGVQSSLKKLALVRIDFSEHEKPARELSKTYSVLGIPTLLFLDETGSEIPGSRINGFIGPVQLISHIEMILAAQNPIDSKT